MCMGQNVIYKRENEETHCCPRRPSLTFAPHIQPYSLVVWRSGKLDQRTRYFDEVLA